MNGMDDLIKVIGPLWDEDHRGKTLHEPEATCDGRTWSQGRTLVRVAVGDDVSYYWVLPGGQVKRTKDESPEETSFRILMEHETQISG